MKNDIRNWLEWLCFIILFFLMIYALGSCTAPPTRQEYLKNNNPPAKYTWRIKTGFINQGMTDEMTLASWGEPDTIQVSGDCKRYGYYLKRDTTWVYFRNTVLISVKY